MKPKKRKRNISRDIIKVYRRSCREEEIRLHGKPISNTSVRKSKKIYNRKRLSLPNE